MGPSAAPIIDSEVDRIVNLLNNNSSDIFIAILLLETIIDNASTLFNVHVLKFLDPIWVALAHPKHQIRLVAIDCMQKLLKLIFRRDYRQSRHWYDDMHQKAIEGLKKNTVEFLHSSIAVLRLLLKEGGIYMKKHFIDVCELTMRLKGHKEKLVTKEVILLFPELAKFDFANFSRYYLKSVTEFLFCNIMNEKQDIDGLKALTRIILIAEGNVKVPLKTLISRIEYSLENSKNFVGNRKKHVDDIFKTITVLSEALRQKMSPFMGDLLDSIFKHEISEEMVKALQSLRINTESTTSKINQRLAIIILKILKNNMEENSVIEAKLDKYQKITFFMKKPNCEKVNQIPVNTIKKKSEIKTKSTLKLILALKTTRMFNLFSKNVPNNIRLHIVPYLDHEDTDVRKEAVLSCSNLLLEICKKTKYLNQYERLLSSDIIERLVLVGICDTDGEVRKTIFMSLYEEFDLFLSQEEFISNFFIALNDEILQIRQLAIKILGRLSARNPLFVFPSLKKIFVQLLFEIKNSSSEQHASDSNSLIAALFLAAPKLVCNYVDPIMNTIHPQLRKNDSSVAHALTAVGALSKASNSLIDKYQHELVPQLLSIVVSRNSCVSCKVALRTLRELFESGGKVVSPYSEHPNLLPAILVCLGAYNGFEVRREASKLVGYLGAWNPDLYRNMRDAKGWGGDKEDWGYLNEVELPVFREDRPDPRYFDVVAINEMVRILADGGLHKIHDAAINSIISIVQNTKNFSQNDVIRKIIETVIHLLKINNEMSKTNENLICSLFESLIVLIPLSSWEQGDIPSELFKVIKLFWNCTSENLFQILINVIEEIFIHINDLFSEFISEFMLMIMDKFRLDFLENKNVAISILIALRSFTKFLSDYLFYLVPVILNICEEENKDAKLQKESLLTLCKICDLLDVKAFSSKIIHTICRIIDKNDKNLIILINIAMHTIFQLNSYQSSEFVIILNRAMKKKDIVEQRYFDILKKCASNQKFDYRKILSKDSVSFEKSAKSEFKQTKFETFSNFLRIEQNFLKNAWNTSQRATKEDWEDWIRSLSLELVKENPSPGIRNCYKVALKYPTLARELFNYSFLSCWFHLESNLQDDFIQNLEGAFNSNKIPHEIIYSLLLLVDFMDRKNLPLPVKISTLGRQAVRIQSFTKALHYKEDIFRTSPTSTIEEIISIYNHLQQPESADGILEFALKSNIKLNDTWYEKLRHWEKALEIYEFNSAAYPNVEKWKIGRLRCLEKLGENNQLLDLALKMGGKMENEEFLSQLTTLGAKAAWRLGDWDKMEKFVDAKSRQKNKRKLSCPETSFFKAVLNVHKGEFAEATKSIEKTRKILDGKLTSLVGESYERAYSVIIKLQNLTELEETINFKKLVQLNLSAKQLNKEKDKLKSVWKKRILGCQRDVDTWQQLLDIHSLTTLPTEETKMYLEFASICRTKGQNSKSFNIINKLLRKNSFDDNDIEAIFSTKGNSSIKYAFIKHLRVNGYPHYSRLYAELASILSSGEKVLKSKCLFHRATENGKSVLEKMESVVREKKSNFRETEFEGNGELTEKESQKLEEILVLFEQATQLNPENQKAFHSLALMHYKTASFFDALKQSKKAEKHCVLAARNFFKSFSLGEKGGRNFGTFQDALRVINLLFGSSQQKEVQEELEKGFKEVSVDIWLNVIPQIIARIMDGNCGEQKLVRDLLIHISETHPQSLMYPVTVATKSEKMSRKSSALFVFSRMKARDPELAEQAMLVSDELIRVAIPWPEICAEKLLEASHDLSEKKFDLFDKKVAKFYKLVIEASPKTSYELKFKQAFAADFEMAFDFIKKAQLGRRADAVERSLAINLKLVQRIQKKLSSTEFQDLADVSPALMKCKNLKLIVPGKYFDDDDIAISKFERKLTVINSKRKPKKLTILASNGKPYTFILKGNEDLRQDERVMQFFGLINKLFQHARDTNKGSFSIRRYAVVPLSPLSGLIEWVPNCDTLFDLVQSHRSARRANTRREAQLEHALSGGKRNLSLLQKMHIFESVSADTSAGDLREAIWARSRDASVWFQSRSTFARSLAVMSVVGYVLGLGDRHPCNLLVHRGSGKVVHIDFGDCFEVASEREFYPERVPFRLTRMMEKALGASGVEGLFRHTAEAVMRVLRENRESLLAVLEAFVYDPLLNWRLGVEGEGKTEKSDGIENGFIKSELKAEIDRTMSLLPIASRRAKSSEKDSCEINLMALKIMKRISAKLSGTEFGEFMNEKQQVNELILQATSVKNLSQCYVGWCPFW